MQQQLLTDIFFTNIVNNNSIKHPNINLKNYLNLIYHKYNKKYFIHPDPLEFIYKYEDNKNKEIVGLIAACIAYGQVNQILKSINFILTIMNNPYDYLKYQTEKQIKYDFANFKHRFTGPDQLCTLLLGIKKTLKEYSSLQNCFCYHIKPDVKNYIDALENFIQSLNGPIKGFLPSPYHKSACKRLNLFLKWMIRKDDVDPGCWANHQLTPAKLIIPLDTHMHKISLKLNLTRRKQADLVTAIEITENLKKYNDTDPIKYDFVLTRFMIHKNFYKIHPSKRINEPYEQFNNV